MLKSAFLGVLGAVCLAAPSFAQSTATPVVTGYLSTSGCPSGQTSCFVQYGSTGPPSSVTVTPASVTGGVTGPTVGTSSAQALAAGLRIALAIQNVSATASVGCRADGGTAALNTAGTYMLSPGQLLSWGPTAIPAGQVNCIASASSTPITIEAH